MEKFTVEFYVTANGETPIDDFLDALDMKMRTKVLGVLSVLEEKGNLLREPYSKHLEDGIFELRCKVGTNIVRVLYFFYFGKQVILTNGFVKKTQKTPRAEIALAKKRRNDYLERMGEQ